MDLSPALEQLYLDFLSLLRLLPTNAINQVAWPHTWRCLSPIMPKAGKPEAKVLVDSVSGEEPLCGLWMAVFLL